VNILILIVKLIKSEANISTGQYMCVNFKTIRRLLIVSKLQLEIQHVILSIKNKPTGKL